MNVMMKNMLSVFFAVLSTDPGLKATKQNINLLMKLFENLPVLMEV